MKNVTIYTDGACSGNPGKGGWAALLKCNNIEKEIYGAEENTTNNRMELMAAINALEILKEPCCVEIFTDSKYVKDGITKWIASWQKNNWKNSAKKTVKNKELWERLLNVSKKHEINWNWIEGHAGHEFNERVDQLTRSQCKS